MQRSVFIIKILILTCVVSLAIMTAGCVGDNEGLQSKAASESIITGDTDTPAEGSSTAPEDGAGDIVLYSGNQIVLFYGTNSWAYTRLGKIKGKSASELEELLGNGDVTITISIE